MTEGDVCVCVCVCVCEYVRLGKEVTEFLGSVQSCQPCVASQKMLKLGRHQLVNITMGHRAIDIWRMV